MKPFTQHAGLVAPLDRANVDTDLIIPKQFLKSIKRTGFGQNLFDELRYLDEGLPGQDCSKRPLNTEFVLKAALSGRQCAVGAQELRLRLQSRACALGTGRVWLSQRDCAQLCRYLLQ